MKKYLLSIFILIILSLGFSCKSSIKKLPSPTQSDLSPDSPSALESLEQAQKIIIPEINPNLIDRLNQYKKVKHKVYQITSGDVFDLFVYEEEDLTMEAIKVKIDGTLTIKLIGEVDVLGNTLAEANEKIRILFKQFLIEPRPVLVPKKLVSNRVWVRGGVKDPKIIFLERNLSITEAIYQAGGIVQMGEETDFEVDFSKSYLLRDDSLLPVDFEALMVRGSAQYDLPLINGDTVYIGWKRKGGIYTLGEINRPGYYKATQNLTLLKLLSLAGGTKNSSSKQIILIRGGLQSPEAYSLPLADFLNGKSSDILLQDGDIVYLPPSWLEKWNTIVRYLLPNIDTVDKSVNIIDTIRGW